MQCKNHPEVSAVARCAGCADTFCPNCLVDIQGQQYCGSCKVLAIQGQGAPVMPGVVRETCKEAKDALIMAILGLFCFGIILGPVAIVKASKAKKMIARDPALGGEGMATAAMVIGVIVLVLWIIGMFVRFSQIAQM
jgi:hypothetical protein